MLASMIESSLKCTRIYAADIISRQHFQDKKKQYSRQDDTNPFFYDWLDTEFNMKQIIFTIPSLN